MLHALTGWHWLFLGLLFLCLEIFGFGGIFIGMGAGAIGVALIMAILPISWPLQLILFGLIYFVSMVIFWKFFRIKPAENHSRVLNSHIAQLLGIKVSLLQGISGGRGKVQIQDALWTVTCDEELPSGSLVEVVDCKDGILIVKKFNR